MPSSRRSSFSDDPAAGPVAGDDGHLQPVQAQVLEGEAGHHDQRLGHVAVAGVGLVDPVADVGVLERPPLDARQVDLPGEVSGDEDPEAVAGAQLPLPLPGAAAGVERRLALGVVGLAGRRLRLPLEQPARGCAGAPRARRRSRPRPGAAGGPACRGAGWEAGRGPRGDSTRPPTVCRSAGRRQVRLMTRPSRMSASLTRQLGELEVAHDGDDDRPRRRRSRRPAPPRGRGCAPAGAALGGEGAEDVLGRRPGEARSGGSGRGRRSPARARPRPWSVTVPARPTRRARLGRRGHVPRHVVEVVADDGRRRWLSSSGAGGSECEELLGEAHAADVDRARLDRPSGSGWRPDRELGGAAADVDDQERAVGRVELGGGAQERQPGLLLAAEQLGRTPTAASAASKKSSRLAASRAADVAVMRTRSTPWRSRTWRYSRQDGDRALDGLRRQPAGGVDALAQPGDPHEPLERAPRRRRPPGAGWSSCRSRSPPAGGHGSCSSASGSTHRPTGSSPPARCQA